MLLHQSVVSILSVPEKNDCIIDGVINVSNIIVKMMPNLLTVIFIS